MTEVIPNQSWPSSCSQKGALSPYQILVGGSLTEEQSARECARESIHQPAIPNWTGWTQPAGKELDGKCQTRQLTTGRKELATDEQLLLCHQQSKIVTEGLDACGKEQLLQAAQKIATSEPFADVAGAGSKGLPRAQLLIAAPKGGEKEAALYLRASLSLEKQLTGWFKKLCAAGSDGEALNRAWGRAPSVIEIWLFLPDRYTGEDNPISKYADELLDMLLVGNRPVARWRTSFFAPVERHQVFPAMPPACWKQDDPKPDATSYFLPHLEGLNGIQTWLKDGLKEPSISVQHPGYNENSLKADISHIRLHDFGGGKESRLLLEWQVGCDEEFSCEQPTFWCRLLDEDPPKAWSAAGLTDFIAAARFVSHGYDQEYVQAQKTVLHISCTVKVGEDECTLPGRKPKPVSANSAPELTSFLIECLGLNGVIKPVRHQDDRAKVMSSIILEGGSPKSGELDSLLAAINTVDPYRPLYDGSFSQKEFQDSQYRRFWDWGSHYMATDHSFAFAGFRQADDLGFNPPQCSFSERKIHCEHMKDIYWHLFVLVQFQNLALEDVTKSLAELADKEDREDELKKITNLRERWIGLRNARWFNRVSTQVQGEELYRLLQDRTRIGPEVELLTDKLVDLEGIVALEHEHTENERRENQEKLETRKQLDLQQAEKRSRLRRHMLEVLVLPVTIYTLLHSLLGITPGNKGTSIGPAMEPLARGWFNGSLASTAGAIAILIALIFSVASDWKEKRESWAEWLKPSRRWHSYALLLAGLLVLIFANVCVFEQPAEEPVIKQTPASDGLAQPSDS